MELSLMKSANEFLNLDETIFPENNKIKFLHDLSKYF